MKKCLTNGIKSGKIYKLSARKANVNHRVPQEFCEASIGKHKNVEKKALKNSKKHLTNDNDCDILYKLSARVGGRNGP